MNHFINFIDITATNLRKIINDAKEVQENNGEVEIGSYPFFRTGTVGVSIVLRSEEESKINI